MSDRPHYEIKADLASPLSVATELCSAYTAGRIGWALDQLSLMSPYQAAIVTHHLVRLLPVAGTDASGFLTLLKSRASHDPAPKRRRRVPA